VPEEVRQRCLARMVNWWKLAQCVLESDFPQYDLLHSFAVFDLDLATDMAARSRMAMHWQLGLTAWT
jgi:hypothetical protein